MGQTSAHFEREKTAHTIRHTHKKYGILNNKSSKLHKVWSWLNNAKMKIARCHCPAFSSRMHLENALFMNLTQMHFHRHLCACPVQWTHFLYFHIQWITSNFHYDVSFSLITITIYWSFWCACFQPETNNMKSNNCLDSDARKQMETMEMMHTQIKWCAFVGMFWFIVHRLGKWCECRQINNNSHQSNGKLRTNQCPSSRTPTSVLQNAVSKWRSFVIVV